MRTGKRGGAGGLPRARREAPALRLLPSICRDCGRDEREVALSPYLDFRLCEQCIRQREKEVFAAQPTRSKPPARSKPTARKGPGTPAKKGKGRGPPGKKPRR